MKRIPSSLIFLAVFVILAALVFFQNQDAPSAQIILTSTPMPEATEELVLDGSLLRVFPELAVLQIQAIRLQDLTTGDDLLLMRDASGDWIAPDYEEGTLDTSAASSIARTFVLLPYGRSINILNDTVFSDYGFSGTSQLLFQVIKTDGTSHTVAIGNLIADESAYYTLVDERDEIFEVQRGPVDFLRNHILSPPINLTK